MIEKIIWDDAGGFGEVGETWHSAQEIIDMYHNAQFGIVSIGHVVHEDDDSLIIAQSKDDQYGQYANPLRIPKRLILSRADIATGE